MHHQFPYAQHARELVRHFTPNWFTVCMGTGIVALILAKFAPISSAFFELGQLLWLLNSLLFVLLSTLYGLRWLLYPHEARRILSHPSMLLFFGAIPMALATILNGVLVFAVPLYGESAVNIALALWYLDVVLAVIIAWGVPFCMYSRQQHCLTNMSAVWLLPIVACEVAASSGGMLLAYLPVSSQSAAILIASYVLWGVSVFPAFAILTLLMLRLALHQLPAKELAISSWLALGPIGTAALALLLLGAQAPAVMSSFGAAELGQMMQQMGTWISVLLLGFALWWLGIAALTTLYHLRRDLPFNLGWWALTFPLGVVTLALFQLAAQLPLGFLAALAQSCAVILFGLWLMVMVKTLVGVSQGQLIFSPCLQQDT